MINKNDQFILFKIARESINNYLRDRRMPKYDPEIIPGNDLKRVAGTFVTLTKNGDLRGCIGHLEAINTIYQDVAENAVSAAFFDSRFNPLSDGELAGIKIEISVLGKPMKYTYKTTAELLQTLKETKPGLILKKSWYQATYLPQVWEDLPQPELFLSSLCAKAGLEADSWQNNILEIYTYQAEVFGEE